MPPPSLDNIVISPSTPVLGRGLQGTVYAISDDAVAKVYYFAPRVIRKLMVLGEDPAKVADREYYIQEMLRQYGFPVPEPYGTAEVTVKRPSNLFGLLKPRRTALVSERIKGIKGSMVEDKYLKRVLQLFNAEIKKAWELGFTSLDVRLEDTLFVPSEGKLYLVDFGLWSHPSVSLL